MSALSECEVQYVDCTKSNAKTTPELILRAPITVVKFLIGIKETRVQSIVSLRSRLNWKVTKDEEKKQIIFIAAICDDGIHLYACAGICG